MDVVREGEEHRPTDERVFVSILVLMDVVREVGEDITSDLYDTLFQSLF